MIPGCKDQMDVTIKPHGPKVVHCKADSGQRIWPSEGCSDQNAAPQNVDRWIRRPCTALKWGQVQDSRIRGHVHAQSKRVVVAAHELVSSLIISKWGCLRLPISHLYCVRETVETLDRWKKWALQTICFVHTLCEPKVTVTGCFFH